MVGAPGTASASGPAPTVYVGSNYYYPPPLPVTPIDTATNVAGPTIGLDIPGSSAMAINPGGTMAYVVGWNFNTLTPVDLATGTAGPDVTIAPDQLQLVKPDAIAITPDGATAWVASTGYFGNHQTPPQQQDNTVTPIDLATMTVGTPIVVSHGQDRPRYVAISPDGTTLYVTQNHAGTVMAIDLATRKVEARIAVGGSPWQIAVSPNGKTVYVAVQSPNSVVAINATSDQVKATIPVGPSPGAVALTPNGKTLYVANPDDNSVTPVSVSTNTAGSPIPVGSDPVAIAVTPNGATAYAADFGDIAVTPIDTATNTAGPEITVAPGGCRGCPTGPDDLAITPDQGPVAALTITARHAGARSVFDASGSSAPGSPINKYVWNFGDGRIMTTSQPRVGHIYATAGTYTVSLTLTDGDGTSTSQVFTGQTVSLNGGPAAHVTQPVVVAAP
jgi:YVTN family beta-propeller protein